MTCKFDCSHVHTKTKTEIGLLMLSCVADSLNLALDASVTEAAGNENAVAIMQKLVCRFRSNLF